MNQSALLVNNWKIVQNLQHSRDILSIPLSDKFSDIFEKIHIFYYSTSLL